MKRLLIVTDNASVSDDLLRSFGADTEVVVAREGRDALDAMSSFVPAAVVVDLQTGSSGGFSLSRDMKDDVRLAAVRVVVLIERSQDHWLADQARADVSLVKPVSGERVRAELERLGAL